MSTLAAVGRSLMEKSGDAGRNAARDAVASLGRGPVDLAIVFATTGHDQAALIEGVQEVLGSVPLVGCSGEGVISHSESVECEHAVTLMALRSDRIKFETFLLDDYAGDPAGRGVELARQIAANGDDVMGLLVFPDGLQGNCTEFLHALQAQLPFPMLVAGGTSADAMRFEKTYQYSNGVVTSGGVSALLLRGQGSVEYAVSHGCAPIGLERVVTRAQDGWVHEIDGEPAWSVFKEYLDGDPADLNAEGIVHLCIGEPLEIDAAVEYAPYVIRTPLALDKTSGSLFFPGGGLRSGQKIQLTRRDPAQIKASAQACAMRILDSGAGRRPAVVLQFDCAGRGRILFGSCASEEIVAPLKETLGHDTPWIGFHTYGEIAPISGRLYYHNYTVVLCAIYDDPAPAGTAG